MFSSIGFLSEVFPAPWLLSSGGMTVGGLGWASREVSGLSLFRDMIANNTIQC